MKGEKEGLMNGEGGGRVDVWREEMEWFINKGGGGRAMNGGGEGMFDEWRERGRVYVWRRKKI